MEYNCTTFADEVNFDMSGFEAEIAEMIRQDEIEESADVKKYKATIPTITREQQVRRIIRARKKANRKNRRNRGKKWFKFNRSRIEAEDRVAFHAKRDKPELSIILIAEYYDEEAEKQEELIEKNRELLALINERNYYARMISRYQHMLEECEERIRKFE